MSSSSSLASATIVVPLTNVETNIKDTDKQYLCLFYIVTAGLLDDNMGSDEQEIIEMIYLIIDVEQKKTLEIYRQYVRPLTINELTDEYKEISGIDERLVFSSGLDLDEALRKFDAFLYERHLHPDLGIKLTIVCNNCLHLRQCLHPESAKKSIASIPIYYWSYFDLRRQFGQMYKTYEHENLNSMLEKLNICPISETDYSMRSIKHMELIVHRLLHDGHHFEKPECIMRNLQQGICSLEENILESTVIRARGLPWQCTDQDVAKFFRGLDIEKGGVALCLSSQGRRNGEALVRFSTVEHRELALRRHKHHIEQRYIEVYKASGRDFLNVAGGSNSEARAFLQRDGQIIIRMRGLPFDATSRDVIEFFTRGDQPTNIVDDAQGVLFVHYPDGRSTGDAFVMFKTENEASQALLKHKETMGTRYIELFRSTAAEVQQVFRRSQDPKNFQASLKDIPFAPLSMLPPEMLSGGNRKDCIRVRNLPLDCGIEQILEFLGVHSQHIVSHGVHMVYNCQGQPSGEAFIQMDFEGSSFNAATHKNNKYMFFNGKKRYIEVLQCSGEDMNHILLGLVPSNLVPTSMQFQTIYTSHRIPTGLPISTLSPQMLSNTIPMSLTNLSQSSIQSSTSSTSLVTIPTMNGFHSNATYYPMQVLYYPTSTLSQSIYLQAGQMPNAPMALVIRGDAGQH
ncbi:unnamed protein product [Rotaria magnacalcarata]|uniref:RRM domain-containing protein n=1 Tax=Rotaria magnacalcarata TaxID=392030 RepID=A0A819DK10_9BILA|nr:unnamed protein product [Rotaria magnacalcarata]CAF1660881.1 unnamed protein product [Rotaria magnacalcarata]CAF1966993.1 unnamed protein product [Rotaria magnacalcarata]CAF1973535.1 unnamed protein product [Rotaria magnacalcarata]CAF2111122.1 unnamed protein product [Rotaria magnacalcarata]